MMGELTTAVTEDNLILQGMYWKPDGRVASEVVVIHVHGSYGNFYENFFVLEMARAYSAIGVSLISINTRGRDYLADFKSIEQEQYRSTRIGGIRERFQDCIYDLRAWTDFAHSRGLTRVVLQGHSLGAMKILYFASRNMGLANGLVLLSPPDNFGLQKSDVDGQFDWYLQEARRLSRDGENTLMPEKAYYEPITAAGYLSLFGTPKDTGMFTYTDIELMRRAGMSQITQPVLVTFGTDNEAVTIPVLECVDAIRSAIPNRERVHCDIIDGANHSYHFREKELAATVSEWLNTKMLKGNTTG